MSEIRVIPTAASAINSPPSGYVSLFAASANELAIKDSAGNVTIFGSNTSSVVSLAVSGQAQLFGNVTLSASGGTVLTQSGQNIQIYAPTGGGGGGVTTMGAFGSAPNANAGSISDVTITLQPADATNPGGISTGAQTIPGAKTFAADTTLGGNVVFSPTVNNTLTGANARIPSHATSNIVFTSATLTSIGSANNGGVVGGHTLQVTNETGATITLVNNYASAVAGEAIFTGAGVDQQILNHGTFWLQYDATASAWVSVGSSVVNLASSQVINTLPIARGGTNQTSFSASAISYYDGTSLNSDSLVVIDGVRHRIGAGTNNPGAAIEAKPSADATAGSLIMTSANGSNQLSMGVSNAGVFRMVNPMSGSHTILALTGSQDAVTWGAAAQNAFMAMKPAAAVPTTFYTATFEAGGSQTADITAWFNTGGTKVMSVDVRGHMNFLGTAATAVGSGSAALGSTCPAVTVTAVATWIPVVLPNAATGYMPVWI